MVEPAFGQLKRGGHVEDLLAVLNRDHAAGREVIAVARSVDLVDDLRGRQCYVLDPMLATGGTLAMATRYLVDRGADDITAITLLAAPEGIAHVEQQLKGMDVPFTLVTGAVDEKLNDQGYIVPGLGDAGDRLYGLV